LKPRPHLLAVRGLLGSVVQVHVFSSSLGESRFTRIIKPRARTGPGNGPGTAASARWRGPRTTRAAQSGGPGTALGCRPAVLALVVHVGNVEVGQLVGEAHRGSTVADVLEVRQVGLDAAAESRQRVAVGEAQLGREAVLVEQTA